MAVVMCHNDVMTWAQAVTNKEGDLGCNDGDRDDNLFSVHLMVVSRRNPAPAVASRTNSTQAIPRKPKHTASPQKDDEPQPAPSPSKAPPRVRTRRATKKDRPRTLGFFDRVFLLSLLGFIVYAATVCTSQTTRSQSFHEQPVVCRTLITYRTSILEPYIVPPAKKIYSHTLGHPQVQAQIAPHLSNLQKRVEPATEVLKAIIQPTTSFLYGKLWKEYALPWYYRAFLPRFEQYVAPRLRDGWEHGVKAPLEPYTALAKVHARNVQVYVHKNLLHPVKAWWHDVEPQVVQVWDNVEPTIATAYSMAQPIVSTALTKGTEITQLIWQHSRPYALKVLRYTKVYLGVAIKEGGKARRTYVDPHVRKILDKVSSETSVRAEVTMNPVEEELYDDAGFQVLAGLQDEPTLITSEKPTQTGSASKAPFEAQVTPNTPGVEELSPPAASPLEDVDQVTSFEEPATTITPDEMETLKLAVSVAEQSAEGATGTINVDAAIAEPRGPAHDVEEAVKEKIAHAQKKVEQGIHSSTPETLTGAPPVQTPTQEDDLDDFLSDLGIEADNAEESAQVVQDAQDDVQQPLEPEEIVPELSEEERAERKKQETATKRANILRRHHEWQHKLAALVEEQKAKVSEGVDEVRKDAAAELASKDGLGKTKMASIEKQGEKLVKGLETYLNKAEQRSEKWKTGSDEQARKDRSGKEKDKWEEVVAKVDARFDAVVKGVQGEVHEWYVEVRSKENEAAVEAVTPVKNLAGNAQADLAMDYAWLDDVTYQDWQNYHDLVRTYEAFEKEAAEAVLNSTSTPDAPIPSWLNLASPDPLVVALDELQRELDDIVGGFGYTLGGLKRRAASILATSESDAQSDGTFSIKRNKGELVDDMRGVPGYAPTPAAPAAETATILPIGEGSRNEKEQRVDDAAKIFVGKSKVQVEEAIGRAVGEL